MPILENILKDSFNFYVKKISLKKHNFPKETRHKDQAKDQKPPNRDQSNVGIKQGNCKEEEIVGSHVGNSIVSVVLPASTTVPQAGRCVWPWRPAELQRRLTSLHAHLWPPPPSPSSRPRLRYAQPGSLCNHFKVSIKTSTLSPPLFRCRNAVTIRVPTSKESVSTKSTTVSYCKS
jgi:hypothetical protein